MAGDLSSGEEGEGWLPYIEAEDHVDVGPTSIPRGWTHEFQSKNMFVIGIDCQDSLICIGLRRGTLCRFQNSTVLSIPLFFPLQDQKHHRDRKCTGAKESVREARKGTLGEYY